MKITDPSSQFADFKPASPRGEKAGTTAEPYDSVAIGQGLNERLLLRKPPEHLTRSILASIENKGLESAGPFTDSQEKYLAQEFSHPATGVGTFQTGPLFGVGGTLFPDSAGRINHLALQFGNVEFDKPLPEKTSRALLGVYKTLFTHMHPDTKFTIVAADSKGVASLRQTVQESGMEAPGRVNIIDGQAEKGFSIWIRDSMIPVTGEDGSSKLLIQDRTYWPGPEDSRVPFLIDQGNDNVSSQPHPALRIDGGNVMSNQDFILVGKDSADHTTARLQELARDPQWKKEITGFYQAKTGKEVTDGERASLPTQATIKEMWNEIAPLVFESEFQRKVFVICQDDPATPIHEEQPAFHIDMAVTPVGNHKFLVGDPGMAIDILSSISPADRDRVNKNMAAEAGLSPDADLIGGLIEANQGPAQQANYDNVAKELAGKGCEVERIPCLMGQRTTWSLPYLTYNNCIQENYTDETGSHVKKVYLPVYGCEPLESVAIKTYEDNGYQVVPLKMAAVSILEGAIRCSSYPIEKEFLS